MSVDRTCHALSDQVAAIAHRARIARPFRPSEPRCPLDQTPAHLARGKWTAAFRIDFCVVEQANIDRIDPYGVREFIQGAFKREMPERLVWRSERGGCVPVNVGDFVISRNPSSGSPKRP